IIHKAMKQPDGSMRLLVQGLGRFRILEIVQREPYLRARVEAVVEDEPAADVELEALVRSVRSLFEKVISLSPGLPDELINVVGSANEPGLLADLITAPAPTWSNELKQELLETVNIRERLQKLAGALAKEAEGAELCSTIQSEVQSEVSKTQRAPSRLRKMPPSASRYAVARTYIDWRVTMPWKEETTDAVALAHSRAILDE